MRYPYRPVPETVTVRPGLASSLSGLTPFELQGAAHHGGSDNPAFIRGVRMPLGTEYRLDDLLYLIGTIAIVEPSTGDEEPF